MTFERGNLNGIRLSRREFLERSAALTTLVAIGQRPAEALATLRPFPRNVRVSKDGFASHTETAVAVNPRDPKNLLGACIVTLRSGETEIATYASFDGGRSWRNNGALPHSRQGRDPSVAFDATGVGYVCANTGAVTVWRTSTQGRSFDARVQVTTEKTGHPWLAADPGAKTSIPPTEQTVYVGWSRNGNTELGFARSTDGGYTFERPRTIANGGGAVVASPMLAAGGDGTVCAIFGVWPASPKETKTGGRPEIIGPIRVSCSTDRGATFGHPVELGRGAMEIWLPGGASGLALPTVAVESTRGILCAAFVSHRPRADHTTVLLVISRDRGANWITIPVTRARRGVFYFQPQLAVDHEGRIVLSAFALERGRVTVVLTSAPSDSLRFGPLQRVSSSHFNPARGGLLGGPKHGAWWIGDHQGLAVAEGVAHPFWNDTRTGRLELFTAAVELH
jgi:hypothetical protein